MFSLWMMGRSLEQVIGRGRYLALYFVAMLGASATVLLFDDPGGVPGTAGASGALFGLMGAYAVTVLKLRLNPTGLIITLALNAFITFGIPGISIYGHVGGLVYRGAGHRRAALRPAGQPGALQAIGIGIIAVALIGLMIYKGSQFPAETCSVRPVPPGPLLHLRLAPRAQRAEHVQDVAGVFAEFEPPEDVELVFVLDLERDAVAAQPAGGAQPRGVRATAAGACRPACGPPSPRCQRPAGAARASSGGERAGGQRRQCEQHQPPRSPVTTSATTPTSNSAVTAHADTTRAVTRRP